MFSFKPIGAFPLGPWSCCKHRLSPESQSALAYCGSSKEMRQWCREASPKAGPRLVCNSKPASSALAITASASWTTQNNQDFANTLFSTLDSGNQSPCFVLWTQSVGDGEDFWYWMTLRGQLLWAGCLSKETSPHHRHHRLKDVVVLVGTQPQSRKLSGKMEGIEHKDLVPQLLHATSSFYMDTERESVKIIPKILKFLQHLSSSFNISAKGNTAKTGSSLASPPSRRPGTASFPPQRMRRSFRKAATRRGFMRLGPKWITSDRCNKTLIHADLL